MSGTWKRGNHFVSAPVEQGLVILDIDDGSYYQFNETGTVMWDLLEQPRTIDELSAGLLSKFEIDPTTSMQAAENFIEELERQSLAQQS